MKKVIAVLLVLVVYAGFAFAGEIGRDGRFIAYDNGTVLDTQTNLMWAAKDNGSDINWANAKSYCENYRGGGYTDWRMPTQDELAGLFDMAKTYRCAHDGDVHLAKLIRLTGGYVWASETRGSDAALFDFGTGKGGFVSQSYFYTWGALPVRSGKVAGAGAQSQTDEQFIAKLDGVRYARNLSNAIATIDIRGHKLVEGFICTDNRSCSYPLGEWQSKGEWEPDWHGRRYSYKTVCELRDNGTTIDALVTCTVSEDSITCSGGCSGATNILTRER